MFDILEVFTPEHRPVLAPHVRPAFIPRCEPGEGSGPTSRIAGRPWLPEGTEWPTCPNCGEAMQMLLQLDLERLPQGAPTYGRGLAQLFYCTNDKPLCEADCEAFSPFATSVVARLVDRDAPGRDAEPRQVPNALAPKRIVGWEQVDDLPQGQELSDSLGAEIEDDGSLDDALADVKRPLAGDKLAGWPLWIQGIEYPSCPDCGTPMRLVFQIDSNDQVGWQWGDLGCAHLTQCPAHPQRLAFGWACG